MVNFTTRGGISKICPHFYYSFFDNKYQGKKEGFPKEILDKKIGYFLFFFKKKKGNELIKKKKVHDKEVNINS